MYSKPSSKNNRVEPYNAKTNPIRGVHINLMQLSEKIAENASFITLNHKGQGITNSLTSNKKVTHFSLEPFEITDVPNSGSLVPPPTKGIYDDKNDSYVLWGGLSNFNLLRIVPKMQLVELDIEPSTHLTENTDDDPSHPMIHLKVTHSLLQISRPIFYEKKSCMSSTFVADTPKETQITMSDPKFKGGSWMAKIAQKKIIFLTEHGTVEWVMMNGKFGGEFKIKDSLKKCGMKKGWKILDMKPVCDFNGVMIAIEGEDKSKVLRNWVFFFAFGIGAATNTMFMKAFKCLKLDKEKSFYGEFGAWEVQRTTMPDFPYVIFFNEGAKKEKSRVWVMFVDQRTSHIEVLEQPIEGLLRNNELINAMCYNPESSKMVAITKHSQFMVLTLDPEEVKYAILGEESINKKVALVKDSMLHDQTIDDSRWDFNDGGDSQNIHDFDLGDESSEEGDKSQEDDEQDEVKSLRPKIKNKVVKKKNKNKKFNLRGKTFVEKPKKDKKRKFNKTFERKRKETSIDKEGDEWNLPESGMKKSKRIEKLNFSESFESENSNEDEGVIDDEISIESVNENSQNSQESFSGSGSDQDESDQDDSERSESVEEESQRSEEESEMDESQYSQSEAESDRSGSDVDESQESSEQEASESNQDESRESSYSGSEDE